MGSPRGYGHLVPDIEGLALYYNHDGTGYLLVSNQTKNEYAIYRREGNNEYLNTFAIGAGNGIDGVTYTDGLDVVNYPLGSAFPFGAFVAQDDENDGGNQNFKMVPWQSIANAFNPPLTIDVNHDPRAVGAPNVCEVAADFSATTASGCAALSVNFSDASSGPVTSWLWDFGDGTSATEQNPAHVYAAAGTYAVKLTAGSGTCSHTKTKTGYVVVSGVPAAAFAATPLAGGVALTVNFTDQSLGLPSAWLWNFGDGATANTQNPSHSYAAPGMYTVTLTASNACGSRAETKTNYITVNACTPMNVAQSKTATASSTNSASTAAAQAVDGNAATLWRSANLTNSNQAQWLEVNLGANHTIDKAVVNWNGSYFAKDYQVQYWNGSAWLNLVSVANNAAGGVKTYAFAATTAQRFRLMLTSRNTSSYRVNEFELYSCSPSLAVREEAQDHRGAVLPEELTLEQNYPNPFQSAATSRLAGSATTVISFQLSASREVTLAIYNMSGQLIKRLVAGQVRAGRHSFTWDATNERGERVVSGVYLYVIKAGEFTAQRKLVLMK